MSSLALSQLYLQLQAIAFVEKERLFRMSIADAVNKALVNGDSPPRRKRQNVRLYMCMLGPYYHLCYNVHVHVHNLYQLDSERECNN